MDVLLKTKEEIELIKVSSLLVGKAIAEVAKNLKPGVSTQSLDTLAESLIRDHGGVPVFKGYNGFPASLCISLNEEVVHGIPGKREIREGDVVSVDCGVIKDGFIGDSAFTFAVGEIDPEKARLLCTTYECLMIAVRLCREGNRVGDLGAAIQQHAEANGFSVVRELVGHGVGKALHEKPEIPNYGKRGSGMKLKAGMVLAVEPMINAGVKNVKTLQDGWTVVTTDRKVSAHYEHTIAITESEPEVLSSFEEILKAVAENINLKNYIK